MSPISWIVLSQFRSSTAYISRQKAASLTKNSPKYSAPACSITKKQLVGGLTKDTKTVFRMPTSPRGWVLSKPPHHNQSGGQLRPFQYVNSGWFRSNMDGTPFGSGSQSLQTRRVKSGQIVDLLQQYHLCSALSRRTGCAVELQSRVLGKPGEPTPERAPEVGRGDRVKGAVVILTEGRSQL